MAFLEHYGTPRHSGRYPWGSGDDPYQHDRDFLAMVGSIRKDNPGLSDAKIAAMMGMNSSEFRARRQYAQERVNAARDARVYQLKDKGMSNTAIGKEMGMNESSIRTILARRDKVDSEKTQTTMDVLKRRVEEKGFVQVGRGNETLLGISETRLKNSVAKLKEEGYEVYNLQVDQQGTGYKTTIKVLCPPGTDYVKDLIPNRDKISLPVGEFSTDNGKTFLGIKDPAKVDPKRVSVVYKEDGGEERDGTMLLRPGVEDLSLGEAHYAQVRIKVGDTHYLKGMAMYGDPSDFPDGVDIVFNTNKHKGTPMMGDDKDNTVLKQTKDDQDNPFGATVRQRTYIDKDGKEQLSALNIVGTEANANEEGSWGNWSKTLSSQVLSKQPPKLAKQQLDLAFKKSEDEYNEIMSLTNPTVKKHLLEKFADNCDSDAKDLSAAGLPRQQWHVILPFPDIPDNKIYAPNYENGENVVLIRYPHAGRFEIQSLTVDNDLPTPKRLIPNAKDAVGINNNVAKRLSGADFDGDTVLVIPNNSGALKVSKPLKELENFDPSEMYPAYPGMKRVGPKTDGFSKPREMGMVSNLITDMTLQGADDSEIARAVKHSMVVIDAEKHNLNWRQSAEDNNITELRKKYQGKASGGAATIVSAAKSPVYVDQLSKRSKIDFETGKKIREPTGDTFDKRVVNPKTGEVSYVTKKKQTKLSKMDVVDDAFDLVRDRDNATEVAYATYANQMKDLAKRARKSIGQTGDQEYSPSAAKTYAKEVSSLSTKLLNAKKNAPLEKQAQLMAGLTVQQKKRANPDLAQDKDQVKKWKSQALTAAREKTGAVKQRIKITSNEWEAIQAGAVTKTRLKEILANTDVDVIRSYAMPKSTGLSASSIARARTMLNSGRYTQAEVASLLGVSTSTLNNAL